MNTIDESMEFEIPFPSDDLGYFRTFIWYSLKSPEATASVRYLDYGNYAQMFVSCGRSVVHTVGMMVDPERTGTFVLAYYPQNDFDGIMERYAEVELPGAYRQKLLDLRTYRGRRLHEVCEDILVNLIRGAKHE